MGVSADTSNDLLMVYEGGEALAKRMGEFMAAKKMATEELDALKLGKSAKDAYNDAQTQKEEARKLLEQAHASAAEIVKAANEQAETIRRATSEEVQNVKSQLDEHVAQTRAKIDTANAVAQKRAEDADKAAQEAEALKAEHADALSSAQDAERRFTLHVDTIKRALKEVGSA